MDWPLLSYVLVTVLFVICVLVIIYFLVGRGPKQVRR
jgi:hypothetical protein